MENKEIKISNIFSKIPSQLVLMNNNSFMEGQEYVHKNVVGWKSGNYFDGFKGIVPSWNDWLYVDYDFLENNGWAVVYVENLIGVSVPGRRVSFAQFEVIKVSKSREDFSKNYKLFNFFNEPSWAFGWAKFFGYNIDLRNCILESKNKHFAHCWLNNIRDNKEDCLELSIMAYEKE